MFLYASRESSNLSLFRSVVSSFPMNGAPVVPVNLLRPVRDVPQVPRCPSVLSNTDKSHGDTRDF